MDKKEKLYNYLVIKGYEKTWGDIYRQIREELKALGVTDPTKVNKISARLMSLKGQIMDVNDKMKRECKFFGFDMETEVDSIIIEFLQPISDEIDNDIPLS
jgi:regulator of sigma D